MDIGGIELLKVHTDDNLADQLTKALPGTKLYKLAEGIGLRKAESFMHICDYYLDKGCNVQLLILMK